MIDKYQEALDCIKLTKVNFTDFGAFDLLQDFLPSEWLVTLQELIDKYNDLQIEYDILNSNSNKTISTLEKALDMACKELNRQFYCHERYECPNKDEVVEMRTCEECIKKYLLKESEKQ